MTAEAKKRFKERWKRLRDPALPENAHSVPIQPGSGRSRFYSHIPEN
jgi:hypothetical protein